MIDIQKMLDSLLYVSHHKSAEIQKKIDFYVNHKIIKHGSFRVDNMIVLDVGESEGEFHYTLPILTIFYTKQGDTVTRNVKTLITEASLRILLHGIDNYFTNLK